jgi:hypothetical protein
MLGRFFVYLINSYILVLSNYFSFKVCCIDEGEIMPTIEQNRAKTICYSVGEEVKGGTSESAEVFASIIEA